MMTKDEIKARLDNWFETLADYGDDKDKEAYDFLCTIINQHFEAPQAEEGGVGEHSAIEDIISRNCGIEGEPGHESIILNPEGAKQIKSFLRPKVALEKLEDEFRDYSDEKYGCIIADESNDYWSGAWEMLGWVLKALGITIEDKEEGE